MSKIFSHTKQNKITKMNMIFIGNTMNQTNGSIIEFQDIKTISGLIMNEIQTENIKATTSQRAFIGPLFPQRGHFIEDLHHGRLASVHLPVGRSASKSARVRADLLHTSVEIGGNERLGSDVIAMEGADGTHVVPLGAAVDENLAFACVRVGDLDDAIVAR